MSKGTVKGRAKIVDLLPNFWQAALTADVGQKEQSIFWILKLSRTLSAFLVVTRSKANQVFVDRNERTLKKILYV